MGCDCLFRVSVGCCGCWLVSFCVSVWGFVVCVVITWVFALGVSCVNSVGCASSLVLLCVLLDCLCF